VRGRNRESGPETPEAVLGRLQRAAQQPDGGSGGVPWRALLITAGAIVTLVAAGLLAYFTAGGIDRSNARTPPPLPPIPPAGVHTGTIETTPTTTTTPPRRVATHPEPRLVRRALPRVARTDAHTRPIRVRHHPAPKPKRPVAVTHFVLGARHTVQAGAPLHVTVAATSAAGRTVRAYSGRKRLAGGARLRFAHGRATVTVRIYRAGPATVSVAGGRVRVLVVPAEPDRLAFRTQPANTIAGRAISVAVEIDDRYGNLTASTAPATVGIAGRRLAQKRAVAGIATFEIAFTTAGHYVLATSSAGLHRSKSRRFAIAAASARRLVFTTAPQTLTAGATSGAITVRREDRFGNRVTTGTTTIALTSVSPGTFRDGGDARAVTSVTIRPGASIATFRYRNVASGRATITASARGLATVSQVETIVAARAAKLTLSAPAATSAGASSNLTVTAQDAYGNQATAYGGDRSLTFAGAQAGGGSAPTVNDRAFGSPTTLTFTAGQATGVLKLYRAETAAITVSDGALTSAGVPVSVAPGPAANLALAASSPTAGASTSLTLTALDAYGNQATDYAGNRSLTFAGASALNGNTPTVNGDAFGAPTPLAFTGGRATGVLKLYRAGAVTITAADGAIHSNGVTLTVHAGTGTRLAWSGPPGVNDGSLSPGCQFSCTWSRAGRGKTFTATVTVLDAYGNVATDVGTGVTVTFATTAGGSWSSTTRSLPASGPAVTTGVVYTTSYSWGWHSGTITASASGLAPASVAITRD
jgi:hypothetical protein